MTNRTALIIDDEQQIEWCGTRWPMTSHGCWKRTPASAASIARRLAEAQHGTLSYSDRHGGGAVFELRLPAAAPDTSP